MGHLPSCAGSSRSFPFSPTRQGIGAIPFAFLLPDFGLPAFVWSPVSGVLQHALNAFMSRVTHRIRAGVLCSEVQPLFQLRERPPNLAAKRVYFPFGPGFVQLGSQAQDNVLKRSARTH